MTHRFHLIRSVPSIGLAVSVSVLCGCRSSPRLPPLVPPEVSVEVVHFAGTLLTGPTMDQLDRAALRPERALRVDCRIIYFERMPEATLRALGSRATVVLEHDAVDPTLAYAPMAGRARVADGPMAEEFVESYRRQGAARNVTIDRLHGYAPKGVSTVFMLRSGPPPAEIDEDARRTAPVLALVVSPSSSSAGEVEVVLLSQNFVRSSEEGGQLDRRSSDGAKIRRRVVLLEDRPDLDGTPMVLLVASPFAADAGAGFGFELRIDRPADDEASRAGYAALVEDLERQTADAAARIEAFNLGGPSMGSIRRGLRALSLVRDQRPILVFLAGASGCRFGLDLAVSGSDALVAEWLQLVQREVELRADGGESIPPGQLGWMLEQNAWLAVARRDRARELGAETTGVFLDRAGPLARFPNAVVDVVKASTSFDDLDRRLCLEVVEFLEDTDPAARVRAHDWLTDRGRAIDGFDPLAPRAERNAILDRVRAAAADSAGAARSRSEDRE